MTTRARRQSHGHSLRVMELWVATALVAACSSAERESRTAAGVDANGSPAFDAARASRDATSVDAEDSTANDASIPVRDALPALSDTAPKAHDVLAVASDVPDDRAVGPDAAPGAPDGAASRFDGSPSLPDARRPLPDAAHLLPDAAPLLPDAALLPPDAALLLPDAAEAPRDARTPSADAAETLDAALEDADVALVPCAEGETRPCEDPLCPQGVAACEGGTWSVCHGSAEICNGRDDDCNGQSDDGLGPLLCEHIGAIELEVDATGGAYPIDAVTRLVVPPDTFPIATRLTVRPVAPVGVSHVVDAELLFAVGLEPDGLEPAGPVYLEHRLSEPATPGERMPAWVVAQHGVAVQIPERGPTGLDVFAVVGPDGTTVVLPLTHFSVHAVGQRVVPLAMHETSARLTVSNRNGEQVVLRIPNELAADITLLQAGGLGRCAVALGGMDDVECRQALWERVLDELLLQPDQAVDEGAQTVVEQMLDDMLALSGGVGAAGDLLQHVSHNRRALRWVRQWILLWERQANLRWVARRMHRFASFLEELGEAARAAELIYGATQGAILFVYAQMLYDGELEARLEAFDQLVFSVPPESEGGPIFRDHEVARDEAFVAAWLATRANLRRGLEGRLGAVEATFLQGLDVTLDSLATAGVGLGLGELAGLVGGPGLAIAFGLSLSMVEDVRQGIDLEQRRALLYTLYQSVLSTHRAADRLAEEPRADDPSWQGEARLALIEIYARRMFSEMSARIYDPPDENIFFEVFRDFMDICWCEGPQRWWQIDALALGCAVKRCSRQLIAADYAAKAQTARRVHATLFAHLGIGNVPDAPICEDSERCNGTDDDCDLEVDEDGADCRDSNVCNGEETCVDSTCVPGGPLNCDDGNSCTADDCDDEHGGCTSAPLPDGLACDDRDACTSDDTCGDGDCHGRPLECVDDDVCTFERCRPETGQCESIALTGDLLPIATRINDLVVLRDGDLVVAGDGSLGLGGLDAWVARYGPQAEERWLWSGGTEGEDRGRAVTLLAGGDLAVAGTWGDARRNADADAWLLRFGQDGTERWSTLIDHAGDDLGWGVAQHIDESLVLVGATHPANRGMDVLLARVAPDTGELLQSSHDGTAGDNEEGRDIVPTADGTGFFYTGGWAGDSMIARVDGTLGREWLDILNSQCDSMSYDIVQRPQGGAAAAGMWCSLGHYDDALIWYATQEAGALRDEGWLYNFEFLDDTAQAILHLEGGEYIIGGTRQHSGPGTRQLWLVRAHAADDGRVWSVGVGPESGAVTGILALGRHPSGAIVAAGTLDAAPIWFYVRPDGTVCP